MTCPKCDCPKHAVYGRIELKNGLVTKWLAFVDGRLSRAEAEAEAVRVRCAWWKGVVVRCEVLTDE